MSLMLLLRIQGEIQPHAKQWDNANAAPVPWFWDISGELILPGPLQVGKYNYRYL